MGILFEFLVLPILTIFILAGLLKWIAVIGCKFLERFFKHNAPK